MALRPGCLDESLGPAGSAYGLGPPNFSYVPWKAPVCTEMVSTPGTQARWIELEPSPCSQTSWGQVLPDLSLLGGGGCLGLNFPICKEGRMIGPIS